MTVDIRTLILILGVLQLMQILVFSYQYIANKNINGPGWWLMWSSATTLGFGMLLLRNIPSILNLVIILQNPLILAGTIFIYIGVIRFFDKKINLKFLITFYATFLALHLFFKIVNDNLDIRSMIFSCFIAAISFMTAISLYKNKTKSIHLTANLNTGIGIIHGVIFAYRAIVIIGGTSVNDVYSPNLFNFLPYADAFMVSLLWTFGFIIMLNQRLNAEISESKAHFEQIFKISPDAALINRLKDGLFVDFNDAFTRLSGYTKEDLNGKTSVDVQLWKNPDDRDEIIKILADSGFCENRESIFQRKGGTPITGLFSAKIIKLNGIPHILSVTRDISARKKADEELRRMNEELRSTNIEKDKLFSVIAHDLRNPFMAFMGLSEMIVDELPNMTLPEIKKIANEMKNSSTNLFALLENLLEWSKMEQEAIRFNLVSVNLFQLVTDSISKIAYSASSKEIEITISIPEGIVITADKHALQTIIRNLVSNAVKFTSQGGKIVVSAREDNNNGTEISVRDSGIGMTREMVDNLFKLDTQTNRSGTKGEPSTGLGLILCKGFIEKHGGQINVESEEGKGTVFRFTIPSRD